MVNKRILILMSLFLLVFSIILGRIFYFQVISGGKISRQAAAMRSRHIDMREYQRGDILDRNLSSLTNNQTSWALYGLPEVIEREGIDELSSLLAQVLKKDRQKIITEINDKGKNARLIRFDCEIMPDQAVKINSSDWPGLVVAPVVSRYGTDGFCAHILGYAGNGDAGEGQSGIEKAYEKVLRGRNGYIQELVSVTDNRGQTIPGLSFKIRQEKRENGCVVLTIDKRIQEVVENSMNKYITKGAVVVMDIHSKEILAMASRPTFSPDQVGEIIAFDDRSTLMNRALSRFNPGSVFKILLSTAVLEENVINLDERFFCSGKHVYNEQVSTDCWKKEGHGTMSFAEAFANSCNPAFIQVGLSLGRTKLLEYVNRLHLTDETIIGYNPGNIGTYVKIDGGDAALGNASLGQQGVMLSPLQIASLLATIADDGWWAQPSLVRYTVDQDGCQKVLPLGERQQVVTSQTVVKVQKLLEKVVAEGTGKTAAIPEMGVAGKTATSQTGRMINAEEEILNAWFAGYLPADKPRCAIVIMAEEGSSGAENCAPVFRDISRGILEFLQME
ncbi:MAG: penicillin-binding protein 2 [Syntrophomonas sp.]|nr:penicillin-binding protein 2 [Syntrophomonas sp.]